MIISLYQNNPRFGEVRQNIEDIIDNLKGINFDLLVLPELFATGYQFKDREEAISFADSAGEGETFEKIKKFAAEKDALIVYGFPELKGDKLFNSSAAVLPDGSYHIYQKTHLFFAEKEIFDPGQTGFFVFDYKAARIGMMICFDWRYPESARKLALLGAQIICHPSNLVLTTCPEAMITRALENRVFTITADRIGKEERTGKALKFIGRSRIVSPDGEVLAEMDDRQTGLIAADIDPYLADDKSITPNNSLLDDRRPEYY